MQNTALAACSHLAALVARPQAGGQRLSSARVPPASAFPQQSQGCRAIMTPGRASTAASCICCSTCAPYCEWPRRTASSFCSQHDKSFAPWPAARSLPRCPERGIFTPTAPRCAAHSASDIRPRRLVSCELPTPPRVRHMSDIHNFHSPQLFSYPTHDARLHKQHKPCTDANNVFDAAALPNPSVACPPGEETVSSQNRPPCPGMRRLLQTPGCLLLSYPGRSSRGVLQFSLTDA